MINRHLRHLLKRGLDKSGALGMRYRLTRERIRIIMYHGVSERSLPRDAFEAQLRFLARHFHCVWLREVPGYLSGARRPRRPVAVLTFDDGLANNARVVAPMLEHHGIKATFFLLPELMEAGRMIWNHELLGRLHLLSDEELEEIVPLSAAGRDLAISCFVQGLKGRPQAQKMDILARVRERAGARPLEDWMREEFELMTVDEARSLPPVVEVGSHTLSHPILSQMPLDDARREIVDSKARLEEMIDAPVDSFCYPNGDVDPRCADIVRRTYAVAVTTETGQAKSGDDLHRLPRIPVPRYAPDLTTALA